MEKYRVIISREMFIEKHLIIIIILDRMIKEKKEPASSFISEKNRLFCFKCFAISFSNASHFSHRVFTNFNGRSGTAVFSPKTARVHFTKNVLCQGNSPP
ncbi:hypothetical protein ABE58_12050 [Bacillus safensis]|nr:hypothetical protein [Bacillus safensis]